MTDFGAATKYYTAIEFKPIGRVFNRDFNRVLTWNTPATGKHGLAGKRADKACELNQ